MLQYCNTHEQYASVPSTFERVDEGYRQSTVGWRGVEIHRAFAVKESRHASLYPASRDRDHAGRLPRLHWTAPHVCEGGRASLEHGQDRLRLRVLGLRR